MIGDSVIERCSKGDGRKVFQDGLCRFHFKETQSGETAKTPKDDKPPSNEKVTKAMVTSAVVTSMGIAATFIDESFSPLDQTKKSDGSTDFAVKGHVSEAIEQMMPWMEIYGGTLLKYAPWLGLMSGCFALASPAINPCIEIAAGVRKPRIMRQDEKDIYTDEYKAYLAREAAKKATESKSQQTTQTEQNGKAANAMIEVPKMEGT